MRSSKDLIIANGGGMCKTLAAVERFCKTPVNRITVGGITKYKRIGNTPVPPGDTYFYDEETQESGNSWGLNNGGMEEYRETLPKMVAMAHAAGKKLYANINGDSIEEIIELALFCFECGVDGVEINLACPNVHDKGINKPLFCEDPKVVMTILEQLRVNGLLGKEISIKISPTNDDGLILALCDAIHTIDIITEVVATNTIGGQRFVRNGVDMIAFRPPGSDEVKHVAGKAGRPLHKRAVAICKLLREYLPSHVRVVGVGGNLTGRDVFDFLDVDADGFQCATVVMQEGEKVFSRILHELAACYPDDEEN